MAAADAMVKPSPAPPPRIVVAVLALVPFVLAPMLALVPFVLAPMLALVRVVCVAVQALPYLGYAALWVFSAASSAKIVAAHAWGEGSAPFAFLQALTNAALKVIVCEAFLLLALAALLLCGTCLAYVIASVSGSGSEFKKGVLGTFKRDSTREFFPRTAVLGWVASVPFMLLVFTGSLMEVMMPSPVKGPISKGEMIGSVIADVGVVGTSAISCFVIIPALALRNWRDGQSDRKAGLTV